MRSRHNETRHWRVSGEGSERERERPTCAPLNCIKIQMSKCIIVATAFRMEGEGDPTLTKVKSLGFYCGGVSGSGVCRLLCFVGSFWRHIASGAPMVDVEVSDLSRHSLYPNIDHIYHTVFQFRSRVNPDVAASAVDIDFGFGHVQNLIWTCGGSFSL